MCVEVVLRYHTDHRVCDWQAPANGNNTEGNLSPQRILREEERDKVCEGLKVRPVGSSAVVSNLILSRPALQTPRLQQPLP